MATKKTSAKKTSAKKTSAKDAPMSARLKEIVQKHDEIYGKGYFTPTKVKCPLCGDGVIVPKRGRFGAE